MGEVPAIVGVAGALAGLVIVILVVALFIRRQRINLTDTGLPDEKPAWMATTPPAASLVATGGAGVYGQETGEKVAAPFVEQIEDIVRARMRADATLADIQVDLGSSADGSLEIWIDGTHYTAIDEIPNPRLQALFKEAIEHWDR